MKISVLLGFLVTFLSGAAHVTRAADAGAIEITQAWTRATPQGAAVAGGYLTITNKGQVADRLIGGSTPSAKMLQVHRMAEEQGVMTMRPVEGGLEIKPGETVELKPGGLHIMMMGLVAPLQPGSPLKVRLLFEKAGPRDVTLEVLPIGATPHEPSH